MDKRTRTGLVRDIIIVTITILLIFLVGMVGLHSVLAEQVLAHQDVNVTVSCDNSSECFLLAPNIMPLRFSGTADGVNTSIPITFQYEVNNIIVQNITLNVSNATCANTSITNFSNNITIITQNITVVSCNESQVPLSVNVSTETVATGIIASLNNSLTDSCRTACQITTGERDILTRARTDAETQLSVEKVTCDSQLNITRSDYEHLNQTMALQIDAADHAKYQWMYLSILVLLMVVAFFFLLVWNTRKSFVASGSKGSPPRGGTP